MVYTFKLQKYTFEDIEMDSNKQISSNQKSKTFVKKN